MKLTMLSGLVLDIGNALSNGVCLILSLLFVFLLSVGAGISIRMFLIARVVSNGVYTTIYQFLNRSLGLPNSITFCVFSSIFMMNEYVLLFFSISTSLLTVFCASFWGEKSNLNVRNFCRIIGKKKQNNRLAFKALNFLRQCNFHSSFNKTPSTTGILPSANFLRSAF